MLRSAYNVRTTPSPTPASASRPSLLTFPPPSPLSHATGSLPTQPWLRFLKTDFGTLPRRLQDANLAFPVGDGEGRPSTSAAADAPARPLFAPGLDRSYAREKFPDSRPYDLYTKLYSEICGLQLCSKKISAVGGYQVRKKERGS